QVDTASREAPRVVQDLLKQRYLVNRTEQCPTLTKLTVRGSGGGKSPPRQLLAVVDRWVYTLVRRGDKADEWGLAATTPTALWTTLRDQSEFGLPGFGPWGRPSVEAPRESIFTQAPRELLRQALRIPDSETLIDFRLPERRICLLAWYPLPTELALSGDDFASQSGGCLLVQDLSTEDAP
ncbi:MAG: hypothetical protein ACKOJF_10835, partial [Planctomycetaceae bacterium]